MGMLGDGGPKALLLGLMGTNSLGIQSNARYSLNASSGGMQ